MQSSLLVARGHGGSYTWRIAGDGKPRTLPALWVLRPTRPAAPDRSRRASKRRHPSRRSSADAAANAWSSRASSRTSSGRTRSSCSRVSLAGRSRVQRAASIDIMRINAQCIFPHIRKTSRATTRTFLRSASSATSPRHAQSSAPHACSGVALAQHR